MLIPATGGPTPRLDDWDETAGRDAQPACRKPSLPPIGLHCQRVPVMQMARSGRGQAGTGAKGDFHALRHWNLNPGRLPIPPLSRGRLRRSLSQAMAGIGRPAQKLNMAIARARVGPPRERKLIRGGRFTAASGRRRIGPRLGRRIHLADLHAPRLRCAAVPPTPAWPCASTEPSALRCVHRVGGLPFRRLSRLHLHSPPGARSARCQHRVRRSARDRWPACRAASASNAKEPTACGAID